MAPLPRLFLFVAAALPSGLVAAPPPAARPASPPNVVVILADDMGFSDISSYGGEIPTPNIDSIGQNGVRFRNFYNTARCCPTRASLLTGVSPHQAGVGYMIKDFGPEHPGYRGELADRVVTIPEVLEAAGYYTAMTGKWHLGQPKGCVPWEHGFQHVLNAPAGGFYYGDDPKAALYLDGRQLKPGSPELPDHWYTSDLYVDYSLRFIDEATAAHQPFFLYLAFNAPHFPLQADPADIARWRGRYLAGWDELRAARFARQQAIGLLPASAELPPLAEDVAAWATLTPAQQDRFDHIMAIYAAVVERMDRAVGHFLEGLRARGVDENTLVVFLSDNGANAESGPEGRLNGSNLGGVGSSVFLGQSWATLGSTPFRRYKHFTHEGGIATPCLVSWPAVIPAGQRDRWVDAPGSIIDLMATAVAVSGATYPTRHHDQAILPAEGVSLVPAFRGEALTRVRPLAWEHEGNRALRDGDWKIVSKHLSPWELYNLATDRTEEHDLAAAEPARLARLVAAYEEWAQHSMVEPWPGGPRDNAGHPLDKSEVLD